MIPTNDFHFDVLIIGTGAAGLGLALSLATDKKIALISKGDLAAGSSPFAQGGIAAVMDETDHTESHIQDTLKAGAGLCDEKAVRFTVEHARQAIEWLIQQGVQFDHKTHSKFHLTREGGHSHRRVLHVADHTGSSVIKTLLDQVKEHPNITCFPQHMAIDLLIQDKICVGARVYDLLSSQMKVFTANATVLATGGASRMYRYSSNPPDATGDGMAMAYRAGCDLSHLEFEQFHPTTLYEKQPKNRAFLITEALRGEGALLKRPDGERFMDAYHPLAELAPRDVVARAIDEQMKRYHLEYVYLDISFKSAEEIRKLFPTIYVHCLEGGIDITHEPIPVVPAAHYSCGGVVTNLKGETAVARLLAVGEVAYTGLHGANRMASNSLLECLVFAMSAAKQIQQFSAVSYDSAFCPSSESWKLLTVSERANVEALTEALKNSLWENVGIVRTLNGLQHATQELKQIEKEAAHYFQKAPIEKSVVELYNMAQVGLLTAESALKRKKSIGLHYLTP